MRFLAYHTKGLGGVARREVVETVVGAELGSWTPKYFSFDAPRDALDSVLDLRTVDDVQWLLRHHEHGRQPSAPGVVDEFPFDALPEARTLLAERRDIVETFSLTLSRHRSDRIDLDALEDALVPRITERFGWRYTDDDHSNFDVRVHVAGTTTLVSCRLTEKPLYYRPYRECGRPGSLRPSAAAGLVALTDPAPGVRVVDNFCGAGTILCEAERWGLDPAGGDIDREAVRCAERNLGNLSTEAARRVRQLDGTATKWEDDRFGLAVSNLPWGDQIDLEAVTLYARLLPEYARILHGDASIVLLGRKPDLLVKHLQEAFPSHETGRFRLGFLGQRPWVCCASPDGLPNVVKP